jgi:hypothetical protein
MVRQKQKGCAKRCVVLGKFYDAGRMPGIYEGRYVNETAKTVNVRHSIHHTAK